jgi:hypothetical protein
VSEELLFRAKVQLAERGAIAIDRGVVELVLKETEPLLEAIRR